MLSTRRNPGPKGVFTHSTTGWPMRWQDPEGAVHAVEGATVHPGLTLLWPRCGHGDVPANAAWYGADTVTCPNCPADNH